MKRVSVKKKAAAIGLAVLMTAGLLTSCRTAGDGGNAGDTVAEEQAPADAAAPEEERTEETPAVSFDASKAVCAGEKEETVTVKADASGKPREVTVRSVLKDLPESDFVLDETSLKNIRNIDGSEEFSKNGPEILWENKGEDITYEGESGEEPDVGVDVQYFFEGKQVEPAEIAGKSGPVRIRFRYRNEAKRKTETDGGTKDVTVPYVFLTMAILDGEHFSGIEVTNGAVTSLGDTSLAIGYGAPHLKKELGLDALKEAEDLDIPEYMEISAQASEFSLDFTTTIVSSGMLKEIDTDTIEDGDDMVDAMNKMQDASSKILNGMAGLQTGADAFGNALKTYTDGAASLNSGVRALAGGAKALDQNGAALVRGAADLADGLAELNKNLAALDTDALSGDTGDLAEQLANIRTALEKDGQSLSEGLASLQAAYAALEPSMTQAAQSVQTASADLNALQGALEELAAQGADTTQCRTLVSDALTALSGISFPDASGLDASGILAAASDIGTQLSALETAFASFSPDAGAGDLATQMEALKTGVDALAKGAAGLKTGVEQYTAGVSGISGGAGKLKSGTDQLSSGGTALNEGYGKLEKGIAALRSGYSLFDKEGIRELGKLAGDDLQNVLDRLRDLKETDGKASAFSGCAEGTEPSVRFIIETDEVAP